MFRDKIQNEKFVKEGYCVIAIENIDAITQIKEVYQQLRIDTKDIALYASNRYGYFDQNILIHNIIKDIFTSELNKHFINYRFLIGHFLDKKAHSKIGLQLHQDWSITDERKYLSAHVWIPHQDCLIENGTLFAIPKSHKYFINYRSGSLDIPRIDSNSILEKITQPIIVRENEMIVFHPALFHGSFPNKTNVSRVATFINLLEFDAPLYYYHLNRENEIEVHTLTERALMSDLEKMISLEIPHDSVFVKNLGKREIDNNEINKWNLTFQYFKNKVGLLQKK